VELGVSGPAWSVVVTSGISRIAPITGVFSILLLADTMIKSFNRCASEVDGSPKLW
jgi:hypothetical protein